MRSARAPDLNSARLFCRGRVFHTLPTPYFSRIKMLSRPEDSIRPPRTSISAPFFRRLRQTDGSPGISHQSFPRILRKRSSCPPPPSQSEVEVAGRSSKLLLLLSLLPFCAEGAKLGFLGGGGNKRKVLSRITEFLLSHG